MTGIANNPLPAEDGDRFQEETLWERFREWVRTELVWYAGSFTFHLIGLSLLLLVPSYGGGPSRDDALTLASVPPEADEQETHDDIDTSFHLSRIPPVPVVPPNDELIVDRTLRPPVPEAQDARNYDDSQVFVDAARGKLDGKENAVPGSGGGGTTDFGGPGPKMPGGPGIFSGKGRPDGTGTYGLGHGKRNEVKNLDRTIRSERAVNAALVWLAHHQLDDGSWSLAHYVHRCSDKTCTGTGEAYADAGATAMGLLPFLAAGQTHLSKCPYKETVRKGLDWLIRQQQPDGNLAKGATQMMYAHGLATIALAEAYEMTGDRRVGQAAQGAVNFILNAQNPADGGWRYNPKDPGDTSVFGWEVMALKSAQMAGLNVGGSVFSAGSKWLDSVAVHDGTEYAYQPNMAPAPAMTSVGLLCRQYLGAKRDNPMLTGGMAYLLNHLPDESFPNVYYWYYATQVMHNMNGYEWDTWNRKMRELLVHSQVRDTKTCANGSWPPEKDAWGRQGGRLMTTSLSCLTLEVYYRYLPLFKPEASGEGGSVKPVRKPADK